MGGSREVQLYATEPSRLAASGAVEVDDEIDTSSSASEGLVVAANAAAAPSPKRVCLLFKGVREVSSLLCA